MDENAKFSEKWHSLLLMQLFLCSFNYAFYMYTRHADKDIMFMYIHTTIIQIFGLPL